MIVDRILFPINSLGPAKRLIIWTMGCNKNCFNCANPELRNFDFSKNIKIDLLIKMIKKIKNIEGFTISGGEPFDQKEELKLLVERLEKINKDILIFTGYKIEELYCKKDENINFVLKKIAVLIDGEYIDDDNNENDVLKGSANQRIFILNKKFEKKYHEYLNQNRKICNVFYDGKLISVGIHNKNKRID